MGFRSWRQIFLKQCGRQQGNWSWYVLAQMLQPEVEVPVSKKWNLFQSRKIFGEKFSKYGFSACASFVMLFLCIYSTLGIRSNTVYMILDINPSIQVEMNQSYQVKRLKGLNQDGRDVVKRI